MPKHSFEPVLGQVDRYILDSKLLKNRLGDPTSREIIVHISPKGVELMQQGTNLSRSVYFFRTSKSWLEGLFGKYSATS